MKTRINLLEGNILPALSALALPIMATSLIQMAYNLIDMIWIGKIGASAVASVGAAGMFMWMRRPMHRARFRWELYLPSASVFCLLCLRMR